MAAQAALIQDTIAGMKRAMARYQDSSDSDEPYLQSTNRGNKLKRRAHSIQDRQLGRAGTAKLQKRSIEHAGYQRNILRRNPMRYDADGDELDDEDSDAEADARAAEENPYAEIHLEELLLPLTSASSLPIHPSLSVAYTSPTLTNMAQHACEMVQKERRTLANAKRVMTKLRGDEIWVPCSAVYSKNDEGIFGTERVYRSIIARGLTSGANGLNGNIARTKSADSASLPASSKSSQTGTELGSAHNISVEIRNGTLLEPDSLPKEAVAITSTATDVIPVESKGNKERKDDDDQAVATTQHAKLEDANDANIPDIPALAEEEFDHDKMEMVGPELRNGDGTIKDGEGLEVKNETIKGATSHQSIQQNKDAYLSNAATPSGSAPISRQATPNGEDNSKEDAADGVDGQDHSKAAPRRMRTRAQAQAASEPAASSRNETPESYIPPEIHPLFLIPETAMPDKDFGLPANEADETRRLLAAYMQKQEEVCRGAEKLYDGLLRADHQRKTVLKWCKAEGHVGEMSDGEDWYDKDEWGLEEDLEKGQNEDDGENNIVPGKKTRAGRRA